MFKRITSILIIAFVVFDLVSPLTAVASSPSVDVNLPIDELEGLIQQLEDTGQSLIGEAGIQLRESIRELREQMQMVVDQVKNAAKEVIAEAATQLRALIKQLTDEAKALLNQIKTMVNQAIKCIDKVLAARIAQLKDSILSILEKINESIRDAVNRIYVRAGSLIDKGSYSVKTVLNNTINVVAKVIILVLIFLLLFWLIRSLWKGSFPKAAFLRYGIPALVIILVAGGVFLLFSPSALASILGSQIQLPNADNSCSEATRLYDKFFELKNQGAPTSTLQVVGDSALEYLNLCYYVTMSPEIAQKSSEHAGEIGAVLYPPPVPPSQTPTYTECGELSQNPGWFSGFDLGKVAVLQNLTASRTLKLGVFNATLSDTAMYYRDVKTKVEVMPQIRLMGAARKHK